MKAIAIFSVIVAIVASILSITAAIVDFQKDDFSCSNIALLLLSIGILILSTMLIQMQ